MNTTIYDIAKKAGVSHTTVAAALRGSSRISGPRIEQIRVLAEEMEYHPRAAARMLRAKRTGQIGMIMGGTSKLLTGSSWATAMTHFIDHCNTQKINYQIECFNPQSGTRNQRPDQFASQTVDGALIAGYGSPEFQQWLHQQSDWPWVDISENADYCVRVDVEQGVYSAIQHLTKLGHKKIAFASGPRRFLLHREGALGFDRAAADFGLTPIRSGWNTEYASSMADYPALGRMVDWARQLITAESPPTAVMCLDHRLARAVIYAAMEMGIRVPEHLSVVGFGSESDALKAMPALSFLQPDYGQIIDQALSMLRQRIEGELTEPLQRLVPPELVLYDTVAPPNC